MQLLLAGADDYLTKPVQRERLQQALQRVRPLVAMASVSRRNDDADAVLLVHARGELLRVPVGEVLYFRADNKYTAVRTASQLHLIDTPLGELEQRHRTRFIRLHRGALVARDAIAAVLRAPDRADTDEGGDWLVRVRGIPETLPVSRRQLPLLREWLRNQSAGDASAHE